MNHGSARVHSWWLVAPPWTRQHVQRGTSLYLNPAREGASLISGPPALGPPLPGLSGAKPTHSVECGRWDAEKGALPDCRLTDSQIEHQGLSSWPEHLYLNSLEQSHFKLHFKKGHVARSSGPSILGGLFAACSGWGDADLSGIKSLKPYDPLKAALLDYLVPKISLSPVTLYQEHQR